MIVKKEKYYRKEINKKRGSFLKSEYQNRKRTSYLLFGIIPLYITDEVIDGQYEK